MTNPTPTTPTELDDSWSLRAKASVAGGAAATLVAPLLFLATVLVTPPSDRGFWKEPSDILFAVPAIWLFAGLVAVPASILAGPFLLAAAARVPRATVPSAMVLGAMLGALGMNALPFLVGTRSTMGLALSVFAAAMGAMGAGVAAAMWNWLRRTAVAANVA